MYCQGLALTVISRFEDHAGFSGVMVGVPDSGYHFEFTYRLAGPVKPTPTPEDLVVLYLPDSSEWNRACRQMLIAGFNRVVAFNPYWDNQGQTFEDHDGYRVVLQNAVWGNTGVS